MSDCLVVVTSQKLSLTTTFAFPSTPARAETPNEEVKTPAKEESYNNRTLPATDAELESAGDAFLDVVGKSLGIRLVWICLALITLRSCRSNYSLLYFLKVAGMWALPAAKADGLGVHLTGRRVAGAALTGQSRTTSPLP